MGAASRRKMPKWPFLDTPPLRSPQQKISTQYTHSVSAERPWPLYAQLPRLLFVQNGQMTRQVMKLNTPSQNSYPRIKPPHLPAQTSWYGTYSTMFPQGENFLSQMPQSF